MFQERRRRWAAMAIASSLLTLLSAATRVAPQASASGRAGDTLPFWTCKENHPSCAASQGGRGVSFDAKARIVVFDETYSETLDPRDVVFWDTQSREHKVVTTGPAGQPAVYPSDPNNPAQPFGGSFAGNVSADGRYIVYDSNAVNLVVDHTNLERNVFLYDRRSGRTKLVSTDEQGQPASGASMAPQISADGRYIVFHSDSPNLVANDTNNVSDIFIHDRRTTTTTRISQSAGGNNSDGASSCPSVSGDGRFVAFQSDATNLVELDTNTITDVFVHDRSKGKTERVSVGSGGTQATGLNHQRPLGGGGGSQLCNKGTISGDGRYVVFNFGAANLIPNDTNLGIVGLPAHDVFLHDRKTTRTQRISVSSTGEQGDYESFEFAQITPDGRFVLFDSSSNNLVDGDSGNRLIYPQGGDEDAFVHDLRSGSTKLASALGSGDESPGGCEFTESVGGPVIDGGRHVASESKGITSDGQWVVFSSCGDGFPEQGARPVHISQYRTFVRHHGVPLGVGALITSGKAARIAMPGAPGFSRTGIVMRKDIDGDSPATASGFVDGGSVLAQPGADLFAASMAYRPQYKDLFAAIELEYMPKVMSGLSPVFYGLRFNVENKNYEVRATSLNFGTFGLFDCTANAICTKVADLRGGYGTTGMRVVFSLPLKEIGLQDGGKLKNVKAFSGLGSYLTGATKIFDSVQLN